MPTTCLPIVCPTSCTDPLPDVDFSICAPEIHTGEISNIYITTAENGELTDENDATEWATRMALLSANPLKIRTLVVLADKPAPEESEITISNDRTVVGEKTHTLNIDIDETNQVNYEFLRKMECGQKILIWYKTADGLLYGGASGIAGTLRLNEVIPRSRKELVVFTGTFKWNSKTAPCRTVSVI